MKAKKTKLRFSWPIGVELGMLLEHEICRQLTVHNFLAAPHGQKSKVFNQLYNSILAMGNSKLYGELGELGELGPVPHMT